MVFMIDIFQPWQPGRGHDQRGSKLNQTEKFEELESFSTTEMFSSLVLQVCKPELYLKYFLYTKIFIM